MVDSLRKNLRPRWPACLLASLIVAISPPPPLAAPAQLPPTTAVNGNQLPPPVPDGEDNGPSPKQKKDLLKYRFENLKKDADRLSKLAESLQKEIDQSNPNVLSLDVVRKAGQIEKLAKKIKDSATAGY